MFLLYHFFSSCSTFIFQTRPKSVTNIDRQAFYGCTTLDEITILNPKCNIYDSIDTISETATIYGYEGSTADKFSRKYNYAFRSLGEIPEKFTTTTTRLTTTSTATTTTTIKPTTTTTARITTSGIQSQTSTTISYVSSSSYWTGSTTSTYYWSSGYQTTTTRKNNTTTTTTPANSRGDINRDGFINAVDATWILKYYAYLSTGGIMSLDEFIANESK